MEQLQTSWRIPERLRKTLGQSRCLRPSRVAYAARDIGTTLLNISVVPVLSRRTETAASFAAKFSRRLAPPNYSFAVVEPRAVVAAVRKIRLDPRHPLGKM
jgi:hypothetical protein